MSFEHASLSFPDHWIILLDLIATAVALASILLAARRWPGSSSRLLRLARWTAMQPVRGLAALAITSGLATAAVIANLGPPIARIADEHSYLLAADTFAHGRLRNPQHPMRRHLITPHVLHEPVYASKYPPAQGFVLGLAQAASGHPAAGLVLSSALLVLSIGWALGGVLPAPWPLFGAAVAALRLAVGSYWNQSYWGGSVAAIAGALVLGGLLRLQRRGRARDAAWMMLGLGLLAHSRPVEGLAMAVVAAAALLAGRIDLAGKRRLLATATTLVVAAGSLVVLASIAGYNRAVTGDTTVFPHQLDAARHPEYIHFWWQMDGIGLSHVLGAWWRRVGLALYFYLGLALLVGVTTGLAATFRRPAVRLSFAMIFAVLLVLVPVRPFHVHYVAPITAPLLLVAVEAMRRLCTSPPFGLRIGHRPVVAVLAVNLVLMVFQLPAQRPDAGDWSRQRAAVEQRLEALPGDDLLLVRYLRGRPHEWVWNGADIDTSPVVWAHALGAEQDAEIQRYFESRRAWLLEVGFGPAAPVPIPLSAPLPPSTPASQTMD